MKLHVEIKGQGFPILCLHGHPGSAATLRVFTNYLSQKYQTISPDLRGYGRSQTKIPFTMTEHLDDLKELLEQLSVEKCLLLGWSLGGILALELALKEPERFQGLILVASAARPYGNHPPISWLDLVYTAIAGAINSYKPAWDWNINTFGKRSLLRYLFSQHTSEAYTYLAQSGTPAYLQTSSLATRALETAIKSGYNRLPDLDSLSIPSLVLAGADDRHIQASASLETAQRLPLCQWHCYPNTAHLFPWEIPQQVIIDIEQWLEKNQLNV